MNFLLLSALIHDERTSLNFLQTRGIIHQNRVCTNGHQMNAVLGLSQDRWRCRLRGCRQDKGIRTNTWLSNSKLPMRKVILFIYCWAYEMTSIEFCTRELEIDHSAVIDWNNYLREVCAYALLQNPAVIGGPNMSVEIDESMFTRRKNHAGRVFPQQWVFGGICRETKECFLYTVPDRSALTLLPIIQESVRPGSTIISDQWRAYNQIPQIPNAAYTHETVNHTYNFVDPASGAHTQTIERTWRSAKRGNKKRSGTCRQLLDSYLCEYMWRTRLNGRDAFEAILTDIAAFIPPS